MSERITLYGGGRGMQVAVVIAALTVAACGFVFGAPALIDTAAAAGVPGWLPWLAPVIVDAGMVVAAAALVVGRSHQRSTRLEFTTLTALVSLSAVVQFLHSWNVTIGADWSARAPALLIATLPPLVVLLGTEMAARAVLVEAQAWSQSGRARDRRDRSRGHPDATSVTTVTGRATTPDVTTATTPRPVRATTTATIAPTMSRDDAVAAFVAEKMSQREAATAAGVSPSTIAKYAQRLREAVAA